MNSVWRVRLTSQAELDLINIVRWTVVNFGARQAELYAETLMQAMETLNGGPEILGAKVRDEIEQGIRTLHVNRQGRKGRHFVVFKVADGQIIEVLRLLHDSMDLARHVPAIGDQPN